MLPKLLFADVENGRLISIPQHSQVFVMLSILALHAPHWAPWCPLPSNEQSANSRIQSAHFWNFKALFCSLGAGRSMCMLKDFLNGDVFLTPELFGVCMAEFRAVLWICVLRGSGKRCLHQSRVLQVISSPSHSRMASSVAVWCSVLTADAVHEGMLLPVGWGCSLRAEPCSASCCFLVMT